MKKVGFVFAVICGVLFFYSSSVAQTVAISQFYGGAGSATGAYNRDYVELLNVSATPQSLNGLFIQYGSSSGNFGSATTLIYALENVTLQPGQYYLVGLSTGTGLANLPTSVNNTTTNTINMSGTQGKVALTNTGSALGCGATATPCALPDSRIIDLAAWGGSNNAEGGASVNNGVNITAAQGGVRKLNGCQDTNNNNNDFDVAQPPVPRNMASPFNPCVAGSNIDLAISRTASPLNAAINDTIEYTITVSNSGMDTANNVRATFVVPSGLTYSNSTVNGGFTASESGGTVTFNGGTVAGNGGTVTLIVNATASTSGVKATSATTGVSVDPNNTITETNETNNNATDTVDVRIIFPNTIVGLFGRASLAQLMTDIQDIGGGQTVVLDSNLMGENALILVPDFLTIDFGSFTVNGTGDFIVGTDCGIRTSHPNGVGDETHPGNIQLTGEIGLGENTDFTYYSSIPQNLGTLAQNAYGMPASIGAFRIDNPSGLNIFAPFEVFDDFYLTRGIVFNGSNTITLSDTSRINGESNGEGSETSYVAGVMQKYLFFFGGSLQNGINPNFTFPVGTTGGTDNGYSPLRALNFVAGEANSSLTVQAFDTNLPGVSSPGISRYWQITETGTVTTDLNFNWRTGEDAAITVPADVKIFRGTTTACQMDMSNCTINLAGRTATITGVSDFSPWGLAQFNPNAAGVGIGGRIQNGAGIGLRNIRVTLTDQNGNIRIVRTSSFGYFLFDDLEAGETYIISPTSKQFNFAPLVVVANDSITNIEISPID